MFTTPWTMIMLKSSSAAAWNTWLAAVKRLARDTGAELTAHYSRRSKCFATIKL